MIRKPGTLERIFWHALIQCRKNDGVEWLKVITEEVFSSYGFAKLLEYVTPRTLLCLFEHERKNIYTLAPDHPFMQFLNNLEAKSTKQDKKFVRLLVDLKYELAFYPNKVNRDPEDVLLIQENTHYQTEWINIEGRVTLTTTGRIAERNFC